MTDVADLIDRIRSFGANIVLDGNSLRIVNRQKLPPAAGAYVAKHGKAIAKYLRSDENIEFEERAAIIEFEGGAPREWAEQFARYLTKTKPAATDVMEWSWFLTTCGRMIDEAPRAA
ncbi:MAG: hypothetical protein E5V66_00280 [Mesorhizobium sp.]|uniref:hypothetical protein n=1 Tax=unclassified Mesorhizobium TaxID=325217 RepID=UPI000F764098|nr:MULTISPECIES: hypothetical protein [unclassified Mesorhizobium]AZO47089.1 hypothetical protein EJ073_04050 [Mesorhizobium sp. M4B.F.Ca.ET.058.02.1.1]RWD13823.1 MAG: hypothetical protein EOS74_17635 [Mesorhizobium sp.]RWD55538.1 MAG: hypothetical protein EOS75_16360 [Mesorhizobium sp.]TIV82183.1 MAG: hypothetical protein E5V64_13010 [Mesorhizobium sp.]TIW14239.1 MAG: hypothetical protein E5V66_00280 [Mesorhizobium sp.]